MAAMTLGEVPSAPLLILLTSYPACSYSKMAAQPSCISSLHSSLPNVYAVRSSTQPLTVGPILSPLM